MTREELLPYFLERPLKPFVLLLGDGTELRMKEVGDIALGADTVVAQDPTDRDGGTPFIKAPLSEIAEVTIVGDVAGEPMRRVDFDRNLEG